MPVRLGNKDKMSKKRQLPEVFSNLLHRWFKRLSIIPLRSFLTFNFSSKYKLNQLFAKQGESRPHNYFSSDSRITPRVQASLVNLIIEVHQKLHLSPETLYLTLSILVTTLA